ncbi:MAG TPA: hypothetical protein VES66_06135 [Terriglobales bacterium]|nr:hypothetical protein [Terriglobales bacterium]
MLKFQNVLRQDGFDVIPGAAVAWNLVEQYCAKQVDSAMYLNNEPYIQVLVPKSAQEPPGQPNSDFKLGPDEAIVLIGLTPPPVKYFSYTPYLSTRVYPDGRDFIFASLGDQINNVTVKTTGPPFNSPVALIFTPDQGTDARIRAALQRAGYPAAIINTGVFPASMLKLGYGETADELRILTRTAVWQVPAAGNAYINNPPLNVFRVTPRTQATANPFPAPRLRIRGTGHTEMDLMNKLDQLRQGIIAANSGLNATDITPIPMCYEGYDYIQRRADPTQNQGYWGDSRDALYLGVGLPEWSSTYDRITLGDDEFLMVYGANHVATGKATYMNMNVYASETAKLTLGTLDDRKFPGTAVPYLPAGDPAANVMYAYKISRNCEGQTNCLQLSVPQDCTRLTLDSNTLLGLFTRIYLEPATEVGPALPEILYDRILKFSPRQP